MGRLWGLGDEELGTYVQIARVSSGAVCPNKAILSLETAPPPSYQDAGDWVRQWQ